MINITLNLLGLALKAKKLIIGFDEIIKSQNQKKIFLLLMDKDLSSNIEKQVINISELREIPLIRNFSKDELSKSLGKTNIKVVGVTDEGFKNLILNSLE